MPKEIIKFGNDLNQVSLGDLSELEQNIFFKMLYKLQQNDLKPLIFTPAEVSKFTNKNLTLRELTQVCESLRSSMLKKDFTQITSYEKDGEEYIRKDYVNLFKVLSVVSKRNGDLEQLEVELNEHFEFLLSRLKANFTLMELGEFITIHSRYTKIIFRLLCQYRSTGLARFSWEEFKEQLAIPPTYRMCDIDVRILKPAIKELTWEMAKGADFIKQNESNNSGPCFPNLQYKKLKKGRVVTTIEFTWDVSPGNRIIDAKAEPTQPEDTNIDPDVLAQAIKLVEARKSATNSPTQPATPVEIDVAQQQNSQAQSVPWHSTLPTTTERSADDHPATPEELKKIFGDKYKEGEHPLSFIVDMFRPPYKQSGEGSEGETS